MISFSDWASRRSWTKRPWLIIGKGPSFSRINQVDLSEYYTISLNHVVREVPVDVAHFIDLDAVQASEDGIRRNAQWLLVPRYPHVDFGPADDPLEAWLDRVPIFREFNDRNRLVCYNHIQRYHHGARLYPHLVEPGLHERYSLSNSDPLIPVSYFSGEAVVRLLAALGCRTVRTIGVDGGRSYSSRYADLNTCLANGLPSFDWQFLSIHQTAKETNMDYGPWQEPIRVYVEKTTSTDVPFEVLAYSIRKFSSQPVQIVPIDHTMVPAKTADAHAGESLARFLIPQLNNHQGRAVYLQDTMLVLGDIAELIEGLPSEHILECPTVTQGQLPERESRTQSLPSIMVLDCAKLKWDIDAILQRLTGKEAATEGLCSLLAESVDELGFEIPEEWNPQNTFEFQKTKLLNYADKTKSPWRHPYGSLAEIWRAFYREAIESGNIDPALVDSGVDQNDLSSELAADLELAPTRRSPAELALAGTRSEESRRHELERLSLAAHLDQVHVAYADVRLHATQLEQKVSAMEKHCHEIESQRQISEQQRSVIELQKQLLEQQNAALQSNQQAVEQHCHALEQQNGAIMNSFSLRIGSLMAKPVRAMRLFWKSNSNDAA